MESGTNELPAHNLWAEAFCEHEGHCVRAATVALLVAADSDTEASSDPLVFSLPSAEFAYGVRDFDMFVDGIWSLLDARSVPSIAAAIRARDFDALCAMCRGYVPFWCRTCRRSYCRAHWELEAVFRSPGDFDYYRGACPIGHRTMIDHI